MVCSEPLSVVREPGADVLIFGGGEDDIAVSVIPVEGSVGGRGAEGTWWRRGGEMMRT
jgi:hypothetical protein